MSIVAGALRRGWAWATPRELAAAGKHNLGIGPFGSDLKVSDYRERGVPLVFVRHIRSSEFHGSDPKFISPEKAKQLGAHWVRSGDVLVTKMGDPPGDSCVYPEGLEAAVVTADCIRWRIHAAFPTPKFFAYAIRSDLVRPQVLGITRGVAQRKMSLERFASIQVPVAPAPEQGRIVEAIETHLTRLDAAVAALKRVQANLKRYRASVLKAAVEGRLVPTEAELARREGRDYEPASVLLQRIFAERRRLWEEAELATMKAKGKTPKDHKWTARYEEPIAPDSKGLPHLPEGWCWASIEQLASPDDRSIQSGPFGSNLRHSEFQPTGKLVIGIDNVQRGYFSMGASHRIGESKFQELLKYAARPRDVLITVMATVGRCCIVPDDTEPAIITKHVYRITPNQELVRSRYLLCSLMGSASLRSQIRKEERGQTRPGLNGTIIRSLSVPLPPLAEQTRIVEEADRVTFRCDELTALVEPALKRSDRVRQSILKWAFEGKLADQDPNDEPASVLLERIRAERSAGEGAAHARRRPRKNRKVA